MRESRRHMICINRTD